MPDKLPRYLGRDDVKVLDRDVPYQGFLSVEKYSLQHQCFEGGWSKPLSRELMLRKNAVAVLLHDPAHNALVLIEQFRIGALSDPESPWLLELVAGLIDSDESPEQIARRECQEEAGCEVSKLRKIHEFYLSPGASNEKLYLYYAQLDTSNLGGVHGLDSEGEDIRVHVLPCEKAFALLENGQINNAIAIIALQWLQQNRWQQENNSGKDSLE